MKFVREVEPELLEDNLNESYAHGTIFYHSTSPKDALNIVRGNYFHTEIRDFEFPSLSLSRDSKLHYYSSKSGGSYDVTFALDGAKLSQKYKIRPFDYWDKWGTPGRQTQESESEEVLFSKNGVPNADKYIIGIYIDDNLIKHADDENYKPASLFLRDTGFNSIREFIDFFENGEESKPIKVYPESDLNKQHSTRVNQLNKNSNSNEDEFIKAKSIYRHKQKTKNR